MWRSLSIRIQTQQPPSCSLLKRSIHSHTRLDRRRSVNNGALLRASLWPSYLTCRTQTRSLTQLSTCNMANTSRINNKRQSVSISSQLNHSHHHHHHHHHNRIPLQHHHRSIFRSFSSTISPDIPPSTSKTITSKITTTDKPFINSLLTIFSPRAVVDKAYHRYIVSVPHAMLDAGAIKLFNFLVYIIGRPLSAIGRFIKWFFFSWRVFVYVPSALLLHGILTSAAFDKASNETKVNFLRSIGAHIPESWEKINSEKGPYSFDQAMLDIERAISGEKYLLEVPFHALYEMRDDLTEEYELTQQYHTGAYPNIPFPPHFTLQYLANHARITFLLLVSTHNMAFNLIDEHRYILQALEQDWEAYLGNEDGIYDSMEYKRQHTIYKRKVEALDKYSKAALTQIRLSIMLMDEFRHIYESPAFLLDPQRQMPIDQAAFDKAYQDLLTQHNIINREYKLSFNVLYSLESFIHTIINESSHYLHHLPEGTTSQYILEHTSSLPDLPLYPTVHNTSLQKSRPDLFTQHRQDITHMIDGYAKDQRKYQQILDDKINEFIKLQENL